MIGGWTLAGGKNWSPLDAISYRQLAAGIGLEWGPRTKQSIDRALDGLESKGIIKRIRRGAGRMPWYRVAIVDRVLERPHHYLDDDLGREGADEVLVALSRAERAGEALTRSQRQARRARPDAPRIAETVSDGRALAVSASLS